MTVGLSNNNLITQTIANQSKNLEQNIKQTNTLLQNQQQDSFTSKTTDKKSTKKASLITNFVSGVVLAGLFFAPEIVFLHRMKNTHRVLEQAMNFKPLIGDTITSQTQKTLSNGLIKTTLENIKGRFKYNEILILKNGKPYKRILTKKEEMPNGKYVLREMKTYQGEDILDNAKLEKNEKQYLVKHYKRSQIRNNEYTTTISTSNKKIDTTKYYCTPMGEPILRIKETPTQKENSVFLYKNNTCIGIDKQVVPKDTSQKVYNIFSIPQNGIFNQKYETSNTKIPYDNSYRQKLMDNF